MVVRRSGDAGRQKFSQRQAGGKPHALRCQPCPQWIKRLQPVEQFLVDGLRVGAGEGLVEVMMGIDQARQNDVAGGVKNDICGCSRVFSARHHFYDLAAVNYDSTACPGG